MEALYFAIRSGNVNLLRHLLSTNHEIKLFNQEKANPFSEVFKSRENIPVRKDMIDLLFSNGFDPNVVDREGCTSLRYALENFTHCDIAKDFINRRKVRWHQRSVEMALLDACRLGQTNTIIFLLKKKVNPNFWHKEYLSPLIQFVRNDKISSPELIDLFLEHGADIDFQPWGCGTPLHWAVRKDNADIVRHLLFEGADPNAQDFYLNTPLHLANFFGFKEIAQILITYGADEYHPRNCINLTPNDITRIFEPGDLEYGFRIVSFFQKRKPFTDLNLNLISSVVWALYDVNELYKCHYSFFYWHDLSGNNPLKYAINNNNLDIIKVLLGSMRDKTMFNKIEIKSQQITPLTFLAASQGRDDIMKYLLDDLKADMDNRSLFRAIHENRLSTVKILLDHGAEIYQKDEYENTPMDLAGAVASHEINELILNYQDNVFITPNYLINLIERGMDRTLELVLQRCSTNINNYDSSEETTNKGETPLTVVIKSSNPMNKKLLMARMLIEHGADVNLYNNKGKTPLIYASSRGLTEIAELLIDHGAKVNYGFNKYPLSVAVKNNRIETAKYLLSRGADVNLGGSIFLALKNKCLSMVKLLLQHNVDLNVKNKDGHDPLTMAAREEFVSAIELFLYHKQKIDNNRW